MIKFDSSINLLSYELQTNDCAVTNNSTCWSLGKGKPIRKGKHQDTIIRSIEEQLITKQDNKPKRKK